MYDVQKASRGMTGSSLSSRSNLNANDKIGSPIGFGNVMFSSVEKGLASVIPFPVVEAYVPCQEALAA